jgi:hypothetical protein
MLFDIADEPVALQRLDVGWRAIELEVGSARVNAERIIGEPAGDDDVTGDAPGDDDPAADGAGVADAGAALGAAVATGVGATVAEARLRDNRSRTVRRADANIARKFERSTPGFRPACRERALHLLGGA